VSGEYSRASFDARRAAAKRQASRDTNRLALFAVPGGLAQLAFINWADAHLARDTAVLLEAGLFVAYMSAVVWLIVRMRRRAREAAPRCPRCAAALVGLSERVVSATGRCDACGGQVIG
jgi:hypothetical protein